MVLVIIYSLIFYFKAYLVGTCLNRLYLSRRFKGVPITYAFKIRITRKAASHLLGQKSQEPQSERGYLVYFILSNA